MKTYAEKAKEARKILGITQKELAKKIGMAQESVSRVESGTRQYGKQKEIALIKLAQLPQWYFHEEPNEIIDNETIIHAMIPEIEAAGLTIEIVRDMLRPLAGRRKLVEKTN